MKKIKIPLAQDGVPMTTLREIALLKQLDQQQHPNIVKYKLNICILLIRFLPLFLPYYLDFWMWFMVLDYTMRNV